MSLILIKNILIFILHTDTNLSCLLSPDVFEVIHLVKSGIRYLFGLGLKHQAQIFINLKRIADVQQ